jgi:hypothetical protein
MDDQTLPMKLLLERTLTPPLGTKTPSSNHLRRHQTNGTERTTSSLGLRQPHFEPRPASPNTIADAFRQLTLADAAESRATDNPEHVLTLRVPEAIVTGDADSTRVASGTAAGGQEEARPEEPPTTTSRLAPASPVSPSDIGFCDQCHGPREYCHGHESPAPTPVPAPVTPVPVPAPSTSTGAMAHFRLTREEAMSLADNIANALEVRRQDSPEVPPPYPEDRPSCRRDGFTTWQRSKRKTTPTRRCTLRRAARSPAPCEQRRSIIAPTPIASCAGVRKQPRDKLRPFHHFRRDGSTSSR